MAAKNGSETRLREVRLTNTLANHNKFYEMWVTKKVEADGETSFVLFRWWGRIGAKKGESEENAFRSQDQANAQLDVIKRSKLAKGYTVEYDRVNPPANVTSKLKKKLKEAIANKGEIPKEPMFNREKDEEAQEYNKVLAQRKEESEW